MNDTADMLGGTAVRRAPGFVPVMIVGLIAVGGYFYGLGSGGTFYFKLVKDPFAAAIDAPYYRASLLHVALAHGLGLGASIVTFRLFVLAWFWAALFYLGAVVGRRLSAIDTALVLLVLIFHPSAMIAYAWTCHPDALTYLLTAVLLFTRRPWLLGVVAALGAWNHLAMWCVVCVDAVLLWFAFAGADARRRATAVAAGLVVGAVSGRVTLYVCGIEIASDRVATAVGQDIGVLAGYWTGAGWPIVYTLYFAHVLWLPALWVRLVRSGRSGRRAALAWAATQLLALAAACVTQDTTRVFAFLAWGPLIYCLVYVLADEPRGRSHLRIAVALAVLVTALAPKIFAWKGDIRDTDAARAQLRGLLF